MTQTLFYFINKGEFDSSLSDLDLFSAVIAAVVHDVDHPGLNNNFLIRTEDQKALVYNDQSVICLRIHRDFLHVSSFLFGFYRICLDSNIGCFKWMNLDSIVRVSIFFNYP